MMMVIRGMIRMVRIGTTIIKIMMIPIFMMMKMIMI